MQSCSRVLWAAVLACACTASQRAACAGSDDPSSSQGAADVGLFPKAYGLLANEALMFPVDLSDWPVKIDTSHQLFVDDYLVASLENVQRTVHQAQKHPGNPIMVGDKPWEGSGPVFPLVRRDFQTGRFRMWYAGAGGFELPRGVRVRFPTLYAESSDAVHWEKPALGLHEYEARAWTSWHHHMTMVALAHLFMTTTKQELKQEMPELTLPLTLELMKATMSRPTLSEDDALRITEYHLHRNHFAHESHRKSRKRKHKRIKLKHLL